MNLEMVLPSLFIFIREVISLDKFSTAIILAGGQSSRMGFDKQLLEIDRIRLIELIVNNLNEEFKDIIIVSNKPELYEDFDETITVDIIKEKGPLSGIHAGLSIAKSKYSFIVACDMPKLNMEYIRYMKEKLEEYNSLACITQLGDGIEPFNAFYSVEMIDKIEDYLKTGRRSIKGLVQDLNISYIAEHEARKFSSDWDMFVNLNTQEDLNNYLKAHK